MSTSSNIREFGIAFNSVLDTDYAVCVCVHWVDAHSVRHEAISLRDLNSSTHNPLGVIEKMPGVTEF